jgi:hypothetical protein
MDCRAVDRYFSKRHLICCVISHCAAGQIHCFTGLLTILVSEKVESYTEDLLGAL